MSITFWLNVDQAFCLKHGLSLRDGAVIGYLKLAAGEDWVERTADGWLWMASDKLIEQLPLICTSKRTVERVWGSLRDSGIIETQVISNKQYFRFLDVAAEWNKVSPIVAAPKQKNPTKKTAKKTAKVPPHLAGATATSGGRNGKGAATSGGRGAATSGGEVPPHLATNNNTMINIPVIKREKASPSKAILPKIFEPVAKRYLAKQQRDWATVIEFSKLNTVCITLANLKVPEDPGDAQHDQIIETIQRSIDGGAYTPRNRKPITSAIEAAVIRLLSISGDTTETITNPFDFLDEAEA